MTGTVLALRARPGILSVGATDGETILVRVQMPEFWDTIAVRCAVDTPISALKTAALAAFGQYLHAPVEYVVKLRGHEVHREAESVQTVGAREGSTFLLTHRHRRPVR